MSTLTPKYCTVCKTELGTMSYHTDKGHVCPNCAFADKINISDVVPERPKGLLEPAEIRNVVGRCRPRDGELSALKEGIDILADQALIASENIAALESENKALREQLAETAKKREDAESLFFKLARERDEIIKSEEPALEQLAKARAAGGRIDETLIKEIIKQENATIADPVCRVQLPLVLRVIGKYNASLPPTSGDVLAFADALSIARGCHDYNGGHYEKREREAFHHGIGTVIRSLEAAAERGTKDTQVAVLLRIGRQAAEPDAPTLDDLRELAKAMPMSEWKTLTRTVVVGLSEDAATHMADTARNSVLAALGVEDEKARD